MPAADLRTIKTIEREIKLARSAYLATETAAAATIKARFAARVAVEKAHAAAVVYAYQSIEAAATRHRTLCKELEALRAR